MTAPRKFRVWDGEEMHEPPHSFYLHGDGLLYTVYPEANFDQGQVDGKALFYTGFTDAEGTEVYEGDVLERCQKGVHRSDAEDHHLFYGVVIWDESGAWHCEEHSNPVGGSFSLSRAVRNARVIGNKYENSDLLKSTDPNQ